MMKPKKWQKTSENLRVCDDGNWRFKKSEDYQHLTQKTKRALNFQLEENYLRGVQHGLNKLLDIAKYFDEDNISLFLIEHFDSIIAKQRFGKESRQFVCDFAVEELLKNREKLNEAIRNTVSIKGGKNE